MTTKLVQKHLLKGTQEFEIIDDTVNVRIKSPLGKAESLTVMLTVLNPEPVISKSRLEFTSRVNNEPLLSLYLAKPNPEAFNAFVNLIKQKAQDEFDAFAGLKSGIPTGMERNVYEEPPEFDTPDDSFGTNTGSKKPIKAEDVAAAISMLTERLNADEIRPFLSALESLQSDPADDNHLARVVDEFRALGSLQGAVLAYAPYIISVLSDDPYENL